MSPHWTQRDFFYLYYTQSQPDEPIGAYLMNWRGETFYSRNTVRQLKEVGQLQAFVAGPGKRKWLLVEQARLGGMRQALQPAWRVRVVEDRNAKFVLATAEPAGATPQPSLGPRPPLAPQQMAPPLVPHQNAAQGASGGPAPAAPVSPPQPSGGPP
jgi:hypothetical protein